MLEVQNIRKEYGDLVAVDDVSFELESGEFATLLGPSGCGKSTTLHSIAGLVEPTGGNILLDGVDVTDKPPYERNVGLVFQSKALFPHMTVAENVSYGLRMNGFDEDTIETRVSEYLELVEMESHATHQPDELSGGQQQRVSLARALAYEPEILLLDEPLTGLDRVLRERMRNEIIKIHDAVDVTTLYVTHDQQEALAMSDRVIVLSDGHVQQIAEPERLYHRPENPFVAEFIGKSTQFTGSIKSTDPTILQNGARTIHVNLAGATKGTEHTAYVRPESIEITTKPDETMPNSFSGTVVHSEYLGNRTEMEVELSDGTVVDAVADALPDVANGDRVTVQFEPSEVIVL